MVKRFFFYGVDVLGNEFSIGMSIEDTSFILPDVADPKFSIGDQAMVAAQEAGDFVGSRPFIKHCLLEHSLSPLWRLHCITPIPSTFYSGDAKYSIFYNNIPDLPHILYHRLLYDERTWKRGPLRVYRRPSILKRMEERKRPIKNIFEEAMEEIDQNVKPMTGEMEAVKLGIQYEEKGLKLYADLSNAASHWLEKKFYIQLGN
jgi:hypothetical protein